MTPKLTAADRRLREVAALRGRAQAGDKRAEQDLRERRGSAVGAIARQRARDLAGACR